MKKLFKVIVCVMILASFFALSSCSKKHKVTTNSASDSTELRDGSDEISIFDDEDFDEEDSDDADSEESGVYEELANAIWEYGSAHKKGFTLNIKTMEAPAKGYAVVYSANKGNYTHLELETVIEHALNHDGYVGGWYNSSSNMYYFDSRKLFPEDQLGKAKQFAAKNEQSFLYDVSTGEKIPLDE